MKDDLRETARVCDSPTGSATVRRATLAQAPRRCAQARPPARAHPLLSPMTGTPTQAEGVPEAPGSCRPSSPASPASPEHHLGQFSSCCRRHRTAPSKQHCFLLGAESILFAESKKTRKRKQTKKMKTTHNSQLRNDCCWHL